MVWRFDRDGKKPEQVLRPQVAMDMNFMMNKVVEEGTGKRAMLDGIRAGGKTGTTNGYRDAWFVGFTGNLVCGVWFGNDDYSPTNRMTGGALPAMTWHEIMKYAHQGIELKNIPGVPPPGPTTVAAPVASAAPASAADAAQQRPAMLTKRSLEVLLRIETMMEKATRALATSDAPPAPARGAAVSTPEAVATAAERQPPKVMRGGN